MHFYFTTTNNDKRYFKALAILVNKKICNVGLLWRMSGYSVLIPRRETHQGYRACFGVQNVIHDIEFCL